MAKISTRLTLDLKPLAKYLEILSKGGGFDQVLVKWIVRYKKANQAQFRKNSSGGGMWPPLKKPIRKHVKKRSSRILWDSLTLYGAMAPVPTLERSPTKGLQTIRLKKGVRIQLGGGGKHPYAKLAVGELLKIHHLGRGNVPRRAVLTEPTVKIERGMIQDVKTVANATKKMLGMT